MSKSASSVTTVVNTVVPAPLTSFKQPQSSKYQVPTPPSGAPHPPAALRPRGRYSASLSPMAGDHGTSSEATASNGEKTYTRQRPTRLQLPADADKDDGTVSPLGDGYLPNSVLEDIPALKSNIADSVETSPEKRSVKKGRRLSTALGKPSLLELVPLPPTPAHSTASTTHDGMKTSTGMNSSESELGGSIGKASRTAPPGRQSGPRQYSTRAGRGKLGTHPSKAALTSLENASKTSLSRSGSFGLIAAASDIFRQTDYPMHSSDGFGRNRSSPDTSPHASKSSGQRLSMLATNPLHNGFNSRDYEFEHVESGELQTQSQLASPMVTGAAQNSASITTPRRAPRLHSSQGSSARLKQFDDGGYSPYVPVFIGRDSLESGALVSITDESAIRSKSPSSYRSSISAVARNKDVETVQGAKAVLRKRKQHNTTSNNLGLHAARTRSFGPKGPNSNTSNVYNNNSQSTITPVSTSVGESPWYSTSAASIMGSPSAAAAQNNKSQSLMQAQKPHLQMGASLAGASDAGDMGNGSETKKKGTSQFSPRARSKAGAASANTDMFSFDCVDVPVSSGSDDDDDDYDMGSTEVVDRNRIHDTFLRVFSKHNISPNADKIMTSLAGLGSKVELDRRPVTHTIGSVSPSTNDMKGTQTVSLPIIAAQNSDRREPRPEAFPSCPIILTGHDAPDRSNPRKSREFIADELRKGTGSMFMPFGTKPKSNGGGGLAKIKSARLGSNFHSTPSAHGGSGDNSRKNTSTTNHGSMGRKDAQSPGSQDFTEHDNDKYLSRIGTFAQLERDNSMRMTAATRQQSSLGARAPFGRVVTMRSNGGMSDEDDVEVSNRMHDENFKRVLADLQRQSSHAHPVEKKQEEEPEETAPFGGWMAAGSDLWFSLNAVKDKTTPSASPVATGSKKTDDEQSQSNGASSNTTGGLTTASKTSSGATARGTPESDAIKQA